MSDLQIVLIVIGALIIVAVLVLNGWQERRFHQQVESRFSHLKNDALLDDPKLDVSKLYDSADNLTDDHFSIADNALEKSLADEEDDDRFVRLPEHDARDELPEEASIDDTSVEIDAKLAQHDEIKAIFDEAFSPNRHVLAEKNGNVADSARQGVEEEPILSLPAMLHAPMDLIAILYLAEESSISTLNQALNGLLDGYDKPVFAHGLNASKQWLLLNDVSSKPQDSNQKISRVTCSLQLADRAGAVSRSMLNRFQLAVETLGLDINAHVEWQSSGDALTAANALDTFCIEVDKTMGFHLVHGDNGAFTGTKLRGLAEMQGLVLASDGTFKRFDEAVNKQSANPLPSFVMVNRDQHPFSPDMLRFSVVKAVTFQLDIPHVKYCTEVFNHMVQMARQMEIGLNATLVDDNNKILGDIQVEKIRQQLKVIQEKLLARGIVPGSDSALRLFS